MGRKPKPAMGGAVPAGVHAEREPD
jgi:hypothetical protein